MGFENFYDLRDTCTTAKEEYTYSLNPAVLVCSPIGVFIKSFVDKQAVLHT